MYLTSGPSQAQSEYQEGDPEWCPDDQVSYETQAKVLGIRLLVSWLAGLQSDFERYANPVLQLLDTVLAHDGDLQGDDNVRYDVQLVFLQTSLSVFLFQCSRSVATSPGSSLWPPQVSSEHPLPRAHHTGTVPEASTEHSGTPRPSP